MHQPSPFVEPAEITVVESEGCHFCADAHDVLGAVGTTYPLRVLSVDARSLAGQALMARHRAPMSPLVLVDGAYFSSGRLPRRKLEKALTLRFGPAGTVQGSVDGSSHG